MNFFAQNENNQTIQRPRHGNNRPSPQWYDCPFEYGQLSFLELIKTVRMEKFTLMIRMVIDLMIVAGIINSGEAFWATKKLLKA